VPLVVSDDRDTSVNVCRAIFSITDEGYVITGGNIQQGGIVSMARLNYDVVLSSIKILPKIVDLEKATGATIYSCMSRYYTLGLLAQDEMKEVEKYIKNIPFSLTYSGGEICPVLNKKGELINKYHNMTVVIMVFE
jgi:hypothetical protein